MATVITVCLRKGGAGKTTTAVNLAAFLSRSGRKVLLIDLDDQANATMCVGLNPFDVGVSIDTLFTDINARVEDAIKPTDFGLFVIAATPALERVGAGMNASSIGSLRPIIEAIADDYEYIIIDTQPGHSYLSLSALVAADYALIPLQAHYLAMEGLARILEDINAVKNGLNPHLEVLGIVPVMVQGTKISSGVIDKVKSDYPEWVLPIEVRASVQFVNSTLEGIPLVVSMPNHVGSLEYKKLAEYVVEKVELAHAR